jgi:hypothetical protein
MMNYTNWKRSTNDIINEISKLSSISKIVGQTLSKDANSP